MSVQPLGEDSGSQQSVERSVLEELAFGALKERRRARRWGIFFKALFATYLIGVTIVLAVDHISPPAGPHTALVNLEGVIGRNADVDAAFVAKGLTDAFEAEDSKAVILRIDSPGGSPVQSSLINREIHRLREQYPDKPLYVVIGDVCASGGYYVAVAAEKIFANKASIVGSIGVVLSSFGLVDAIHKYGIERRLFTAGEHKALLDPFSPIAPGERRHLQDLLDRVHRQFIETVKADRGDKLSPNPDVFSGLFWTGEEALRLGLVDEFGGVGYVAREVVGAKTVIDYTPRENLFGQVTKQLGVSIGEALRSGLNPGRFWIH